MWANLPDFTDGFKTAATGNDGKQYFVPLHYYPWAVHYRKSLFEEKGYTVPTNKDELVALATKMQADGLVPFAYANDGKWPVQGTFDILNMRINGYQFHVDLLAGKEGWTDDKVKNVFTAWTDLLPFHQENPNGRTWQEAATALENKEAGHVLPRHLRVQQQHRPGVPRRPRLLHLPGARRGHRRRCPRRPDRRLDDGRQPEERGRRQGAAHRPRRRSTSSTPSTRSTAARCRPTASPTPSTFTPIQKKSAELVGSAKNIAQFLDRDTSPDFVSNVIADAFANFLADPTQIDTILADIEAQKSQYLS